MLQSAIGWLGLGAGVVGPSRTFCVESLESRRLLTAGTLDPSFGNNGVATLTGSSLGTNANLFRAEVIQTDGSIVAVGEALPTRGSDGFAAVMRFAPNGSPDPFFNNGQLFALTNVYGSAYAVALQSNGQIVVAGFQKSFGSNPDQLLLMRLNSNGTLDTNFGSGGLVTFNSSAPGALQSVVIEPTGDIVAGGYVEPNGAGTAKATELVRVSSTGLVESQTSGVIGYNSAALGIVSMALLPSGQLLALSNGMQVRPIITYAPELIRYNADGSIDPTFGNNGYEVDPTGFSNFNQIPEQLAVDPTGSTVYVLSHPSANNQDQITKYNAAGQRLPTFGSSGTLTLDTIGAGSGNLMVQGDGDVVAVTTASVSGATTQWIASRFTPYGELDQSFDNGSGQLLLPEGIYSTATSVAIETDGSIVLAGSDGTNFELAKLTGGARTDPGAIIKGTVFNDINGNGIFDSGETGLAGITVYIDGNDTSAYSSVDASTTTAADGSYSFTGLPNGYVYVGIVLPTGTQRTYPTGSLSVLVQAIDGTSAQANFGVGAAAPANSIGGVVFNDTNGNGVRDANETPLANWTVYLDLNNNGILDSGDLTQITDANGRYLFTSLPPSGVVAYSVRIVPQSGYMYTIGNSAGVALAAGQSFSNINFGESQFSYFKGIVYNDVAGTGVYASSDPGLSGITLYDDANNNGVFDSGETSVVTGTGGVFQIGGFGPGTVIAREVLPAGYRVTTPAQGYLSTQFTTDPELSSIWIGNTTAPYTSASIAGTVYNDTNANGKHDAGETDTAGAFVYIDANNNGVYDSGEKLTATYAAGNYLFTGLAAGTYVVRQQLTTGQVQTQPANNQGQTVTLTATQAATGVDFGDTSSLGMISGTVFNDVLRTGTFGQGDAAINGRTIYIDSNDNGVLDPGEPATTSNANGSYSFAGLPLGTYYVRQALPTGWVQTAPAGGGAATVNVSKAGGTFAASFGSYPILPTAVAGGPYTVGEGASVTLNGSASSEKGGAIAKYEWDFNYVAADGFNVSATGVSPVFSAVGLDGPATRTVALRVTDTSGNTAVATATMNITDVAPTATFTGSTVILGQSGTVTFTNAYDPSPADMAAGFNYLYDLTNSGTFGIVGNSPTQTVPAADLTTAGQHVVRGAIRDRDGLLTTYTAVVQVNSPVLAATVSGTVTGGLPGETIYLDANNNSLLDTTEIRTTTTSTGTYSFSNVPAAAYIVRQLLPAGYTQITPATGYGIHITVTSGTSLTGQNFVDKPPIVVTGGSISGTVTGGAVGETIYLDANNNSVLDASELKTTTSAAGTYAFSNVPIGAYVVRQILPGGYAQTLPASGYGIHVTVANGSSLTNQNFTDQPPVTITKLAGTTIGTAGSYKSSGTTIANATDGNLSTYLDGPTATGNWVGLDLGSSRSISQIRYAPRSGYASRMVGGMFQTSTTADFSSGVVTLYTITAAPTSGSLTIVTLSSPVTARYVRYLSPTGSYGDISEFQIFG